LLINSDEVTAVANAFGLRAFRPQAGELHTCSMGDLQLLIAATSMLQAGDQLMVIDSADRSKILASLAGAGVKLQSEAEFEWRRILSFWPRAGREIVEKSLPQELDRDAQAISFTKGCYLGQETIARLDARGQLQKKVCLLRIKTTTALPTGEAISRDGQPIGSVTSVAVDASAGCSLALAYLKRGNFEVGTALMCGSHSAEVIQPQR
jgi:folate-binding protein YgfZ